MSRSFGIVLDEWQELILKSAMGERSDGTWSAKQVGVSVPRQNGKSQLIVARALAGALLFGETKIVISAHAQDTARETFGKFMEMRDASPALEDRIDKVMSALNREFIKFKNGAVIQFKARTVSGSRGFSSDCLLLDEAQILGMPAWVSINSTMSARPNPQVWLLGTPPTPEDNGEVFASIRSAALGGKTRMLTWCEWSADAEDDPALESTRAKANPAWHTRINHEIVQGEYETYPPVRFGQDRLGRWAEDAAFRRVIASDVWASRRATSAPALDVPPDALSLDRWHDGTTSIAGAWMQGETPHVELLALDVVADDLGPVEWLAERAGRRIPVLIAADSPAAALVPDLTTKRIKVQIVPGAEFARGCQAFVNEAIDGSLTHAGQEQVDDALADATKLPYGKAGGWVWDRRTPTNDISALVAVTLAHMGAKSTQRRQRGGGSYQRR